MGLSSSDAAAAIRAGRPLLEAGELSLDVEEVAEEVARVARNLADTAEPGAAAQRAAEVIAGRRPDVSELLGAVLGDRAPLEREAFRLGVDPDALGRILELALQPFLWEAVAQLSTLTDIDRWDRGYCPVCGAWPALAELVGPEKRRVLRCVRCGVAWSWLVLLCPYCGNDDHRSLRVLQDRTMKGERVDVCERCHGYVKAIASYAPNSAARLVAEDARTIELDVAASNAGYTRPGDVDVETKTGPNVTAGVPARETPES